VADSPGGSAADRLRPGVRHAKLWRGRRAGPARSAAAIARGGAISDTAILSSHWCACCRGIAITIHSAADRSIGSGLAPLWH